MPTFNLDAPAPFHVTSVAVGSGALRVVNEDAGVLQRFDRHLSPAPHTPAEHRDGAGRYRVVGSPGTGGSARVGFEQKRAIIPVAGT